MRALLLLFLLASLAFHAAAGRPPQKSKRANRLPSSSSSSEQPPESEDENSLHIQRVTARGSDEDELADDSGNEDVFADPRQVRFRVSLSPRTRQNGGDNGTALDHEQDQGQERPSTPPPAHAPFQHPTTPESTGRLYFGLNQQPPDTSLYERPGAAGRKAAVAGEADDQVGRQFHSWYRFSSDDRRRLFSELRRAACSNLYDMGASTGASFALFISRPETNPAQPAHLGDMYVSRTILRDENFMRTARDLWTTFRNDIARPRRQQFEALQAEAATLRRQYHDVLERLERAGLDDGTEDDTEATTANEAKKRKREQKSRTSDASGSKKGKGKGTAREPGPEDAGNGNESTPQRPRTRQRTTRSGRASADDPPPRFNLPLPVPALDAMDMAVDDEQEGEQMGAALVRSRREAEEEARRREQPVASTSRLDDPRSSGQHASGGMVGADVGTSMPKVKKEKLEKNGQHGANASATGRTQRAASSSGPNHPQQAAAGSARSGTSSGRAGPSIQMRAGPASLVAGAGSGPRPRRVMEAVELPRFAVPALPPAARAPAQDQPLHRTVSESDASSSSMRGRTPIQMPSDLAFAHGSQASISPPPSLPPTESDAGYDSASVSLLPNGVERLLEQFSVDSEDWDQVETIYLSGLHHGATAHERWLTGLSGVQNELNLSAKQVQKLALAMLRAQIVRK